MSFLKDLRRTHKERGQPKRRARLGLLEKHKDYKQRANDYKQKQAQIKRLQKKAAFRNPDEFYFAMIKTKTEDGVHIRERKQKTRTAKSLLRMKTQDIMYLTTKRQIESKKIERLQSSLHCLSEKPVNSHTVFVDSHEEAQALQPAEYFRTAPELLDRAYNRPTLEQLRTEDLAPGLEQGAKEVTKARKRQYSELEQRLKREKEMSTMIESLQAEKNLMKHRGSLKKAKTVDDDDDDEHSNANNDNKTTTHRWKKERLK